MSGDAKQVSFFRVFTVSLLVTGTTVGAGILALPIQAGLAGLVPSLLSMTAIWGIMLITGRILAHRLTKSAQETSDLGTLFERDIGPAGKWLCTVGYFLVFYGILVAYLAGATSVLVRLVPLPVPRVVWLIGFFLVATGLTIFGEELVRRGNAAIMVVLAISFAVLLAQAGCSMDTTRFSRMDWLFLPSAIPIVACAFSYHMIVPTACRCLDWNFRSVCLALNLGTGIALVMNLAWVVVILGAIPIGGAGDGTLLAAFKGNVPATVPLSLILKSKVVTTAGMFFTFAAILTSYLGVGIALIGFIQDVGSSVVGAVSRKTAAILTFAPPLIVGLVYPDIFLKVLNLVGGLGILLLFGVLPALVFIKAMCGKSSLWRVMGYALLAILILLMALELAQEFGWLQMKPEVEHWDPHRAGHVVSDP